MGRPRKHPPRYYQATDTGVAVDADGVPHFFKKGELLAENDPKLAFCRSYFVPTTQIPREQVGDER